MSIQRCFVTGILGCAVLFHAAQLPAKYLLPQLEEVPIERLIKNLTNLSVKSPKDVSLRLNLARVHAMAYPKKQDKVVIHQGKEPEEDRFAKAHPNIPTPVIKTKDFKEQSDANRHLELALIEYVKTLEIDPNHLAARLGYAWCAEQAGKKVIAAMQYRTVIELGVKLDKAKPSEAEPKRIIVEAVRYLRPLLHPDKDKAELDALAELVKQYDQFFGAQLITPIAIPLSKNLRTSDLEDRAARIRFDADGSGIAKEWTWIKPNAAWLVYDQRDTGKPESALQLFGNVTFWCFWDNGYEAMRSLDNNHDGKLTDGELQHLALWQDANSNGVADAGEVKPLAEHGIVALSCEYQCDTEHADRIQFSSAGVTFKSGETRASYDLLLHSH